jgi:hypothetical protein
MFDHMAEIYEAGFCLIFHSATIPIAAQMMFSTAEGMAPWYQPLAMNPSAPTTFIP